MTPFASHLFVAGGRRTSRRDTIAAHAAPDVVVSCHARLRGPYSGTGRVLHALIADAQRLTPELVDAHRIELLYAAPELEPAIGPAPESLVSVTPHEERTRYFGQSLIRAMSHGIVTFLVGYATALRTETGRRLCVAFDDLHAADLTEQELVAIVLRRADPAVLRVVAGAAAAGMPEELERALERWTVRVDAHDRPDAGGRAPADLVLGYVLADGTSDDPAERAAYATAPAGVRRRLHDERAAALEWQADAGLRLGAIPYHRERGSDPGGAGRQALRVALERCVAAGYSAATVDFGMRGRALCDPVAHQQDYCHFSAKAASALIPLGRLDECAEIYHELLERYALPRVQMTCSYAIAMLHTRFYEPRDHTAALEWANRARALADLEDDPVEGPYFQVYQDNGLALIELHRGNLERALALVSGGLERLERELPGDRYVVHRSQLLHNRARVLVALGRHDEAYGEFTRLIELDPNYVEYHTDRANLSRRRGELDAALADYDRAVAVSAPLPELYYNRADVRAAAGHADAALADLDLVLDMEPDLAPARLLRATLRLDAGDAGGALEDAGAGLAAHPDDPRLLSALALAQQASGAPEAALAAFDRALAIDPGFTPALVDRAVLAFELGRLDAALADLTHALELDGDDPDVLFNRGFVLEHAERHAEALADFDRALALPGADREALLDHRAACRAALDRVHADAA
jgi:tetratricopeptide (TPR) repeat protein